MVVAMASLSANGTRRASWYRGCRAGYRIGLGGSGRCRDAGVPRQVFWVEVFVGELGLELRLSNLRVPLFSRHCILNEAVLANLPASSLEPGLLDNRQLPPLHLLIPFLFLFLLFRVYFRFPFDCPRCWLQ